MKIVEFSVFLSEANRDDIRVTVLETLELTGKVSDVDLITHAQKSKLHRLLKKKVLFWRAIHVPHDNVKAALDHLDEADDPTWGDIFRLLSL